MNKPVRIRRRKAASSDASLLSRMIAMENKIEEMESAIFLEKTDNRTAYGVLSQKDYSDRDTIDMFAGLIRHIKDIRDVAILAAAMDGDYREFLFALSAICDVEPHIQALKTRYSERKHTDYINSLRDLH